MSTQNQLVPSPTPTPRNQPILEPTTPRNQSTPGPSTPINQANPGPSTPRNQANPGTSTPINQEINVSSEPGVPTKKVDIRELELALDTVEGRKIIDYYKNHNILNEANRQELVRILISGEANKSGTENFKITSFRFQQLTSQITSKFPNEIDHIYFRAYSRTTGLPANGKLFSKYENLKKKYFFKSTKIKNLHQEIDLDADQNIQFLKNNIAPWTKVEEYWEKTFIVRHQQISESQSTLTEYLDKYPCLRLAYGYQLLEFDFDKKYPERADAFTDNAEVCFKKLYEYINKQKSKDKEVTSLLEKYAVNPNLVILLILPSLFKVTYGRKRNGDGT